MSLHVLRCNGCGRSLAMGPSDARLYCNELCAVDYPVNVAEDRDALLLAAFRHTGVQKAYLGSLFGLTRQRVDQILRRRTLAAR